MTNYQGYPMNLFDPSELIHYTPPPQLLQGRVVLITGAANGIGHAVARASAACGATTVLLDSKIDRLEQVYDEIEADGSPEPAIYPLDLEKANATDYAKLATTLNEQLGKLDSLVLNAGWLGAYSPMKHYSLELYQKTMMVNLHAPFLLTQACLPLLEASTEDPNIVMSTHASNRAYAGAFGIAKAGLQAMLDILASEYDNDKPIRVNGVDTGPVNTSMRRLNFPGEDSSQHPSADKVTAAYLFFLGQDSQQITGKNCELHPGK